MKIFTLALLWILLTNICWSQNIEELFNQVPAPPLTAKEAIKDAKLELEKLLTDEGKEITRIKSWDYGTNLSSWSKKIENIQSAIEKKADENSFSLENFNTNDKALEAIVENLSKLETSILAKWEVYNSQLTAVNPDFFPLNENEYGCEEIRASANTLESHAQTIQKIIKSATDEIKPQISNFQTIYTEVKKSDNAFFKNQAEGYYLSLIKILNGMTNYILSSYKNLVDTEMVFVNAQCAK